jgi:hypothetical protein
MLYLRTDQSRLMPMTLFGSPDPRDTPADGSLSIWIRPTAGAMPGQPLSNWRWAHSPVWSESGKAVACVVSEPSGSHLVHLDLATKQETALGVPGEVNCMPRFDGNDHTLLFCAGRAATGPMRIYRQRLGEPQPTPLSPDGVDCLCPVMSRGNAVLCARVEGEHLSWAWCTADGTNVLATQWGLSGRLELLQIWAGIASPVSSDRDSVLFYDIAQDRVCVLQVSERTLRRHRTGGIAACWLDGKTLALATPGGAFVTEAKTGISKSLFNGQWIPCRYVPSLQRLILLGQQGAGRFAIWEVVGKSSREPGKTTQHPRK